MRTMSRAQTFTLWMLAIPLYLALVVPILWRVGTTYGVLYHQATTTTLSGDTCPPLVARALTGFDRVVCEEDHPCQAIPLVTREGGCWQP